MFFGLIMSLYPFLDINFDTLSIILPNQFLIFWCSIFILYTSNNLKASINCFFFLVVCTFLLLRLFHLLFLYFLFCLLNLLLKFFISNEISCCLFCFLNNTFRSSFCSIFSSFCCIIH